MAHSKERQTADMILAAFNTMDTHRIVSLRTPGCQRVFLPSSLHLTPQSNTAYLANLNAMKAVFTSFQVTATDIIEGTSRDDEGRERVKIVMFVEARGETAVGEYRNDYVWKMGFEEGGGRVDEWIEYVDASMFRDFYPKLKAETARRAMEKTSDGEK
ncbi:hypothetical protein N0V90_008382 [Kalmusia sp. IMI 367209]|nr:hypothetical protein N0V90_008382 [Kalmusia sp. IMI 367209]